jgi:hypothetical protein
VVVTDNVLAEVCAVCGDTLLTTAMSCQISEIVRTGVSKETVPLYHFDSALQAA